MIIDFDVDFNEYNEKVLNFYGFWDYSCPSCDAKNSFIRHAIYNRNICVLNIGTFSEHNFLVLRLYCKSCKTTHAILPAGTVPYGFYSFSCIMYVLSQYYIDKYSSVKISKKLEISTQMVYLFILKYLLELVSCISFLRAYLSLYIEKDAKPGFVLSIINKTFTEVGFQKNYFINTKQIFLMTRRRNILSRALWVGT